jgi:CHAT domain-containing protein
MDGASVWHFACHGHSDQERPLDSAVILSDGPLTLGEILERPPGVHRLAVLSACDTDVADPTQVDEVVSLPGALLRAGVAGVIASQWTVEDRPTALLMLAFHAGFRAGIAPDQALAQAQSWLRTATTSDLGRHHPTLVPENEDPGARPYGHPRYWAGFTFTGA